jgi:hypothetical protein
MKAFPRSTKGYERKRSLQVAKPLHHYLFGKVGNVLLAIAILGSFGTSIFFERQQNITPQTASVAVSSQAHSTNSSSDTHQSLGGATPTNALKYFYLLLTVVIALTLITRTRKELRVHHLKHASVGAIALLSMLLLLLVADQFSYLAPYLPSITAPA